MASPKTAQLVLSGSSSSDQLPVNASPASNLPEVTSDGDDYLPPALRLNAELIDSDPLRAAQIVEKRREFFKMIKSSSLKMTDNQDWVTVGKKPYLQASGCEKLMPIWGIFIESYTLTPTIMEAQRMFRDGIPVPFAVEGYAGCTTFGGKVSKFLGGRNADDDFFRVRYEDNKKVRRPMTDVDVLDVAKAAVSNFEVQVVTRILGIRNLSHEELAANGLKAGAKVEYTKGTTPKGTRPAPDAPRQSSDPKPTSPKPAVAGGAPLDLDLRRDYVMEVIGQESDPNAAVDSLTKGFIKSFDALAEAEPRVIDRLYERLKK